MGTNVVFNIFYDPRIKYGQIVTIKELLYDMKFGIMLFISSIVIWPLN